ncbi:MAG: hypothetical protein HYR85_28025 [Planctomycetes bacterium]|nr:hypothetical protein [Planctomycetota bacterium]
MHHDLAWNPSMIEPRTDRIDRLGCEAEGRHPIVVYLPYLDAAADERRFRVMRDREQWFRGVMGQDEVARLITPDSGGALPLPSAISDDLSFDLGIRLSSPERARWLAKFDPSVSRSRSQLDRTSKSSLLTSGAHGRRYARGFERGRRRPPTSGSLPR